MSKVVFITGSSSGIGMETAYAFSKQGWDVIITYHSSKKDGIAVEKECKKLGAASTMLINLDLLKNSSITSAFKKIKSKYKKIDVLVNNAGVLVWKDFKQQKLDDIEFQVRTNLEGTMKVTSVFLPIVKQSIVNVSSQVGKMPYKGISVYSSTKFGLCGFTKNIALEYPNLHVISVNPGMTATKMTGMKGIHASKVADLIIDSVTGKRKVEQGGDVNVWEIYNQTLP